MKRDMKLIKLILEYTEAEHIDQPLPVPELVDYSRLQIEYHIRLSEQAGYLETIDLVADEEDINILNIYSLTWDGHDLLNQLRQGQ
jgi:hypothetical protein